MMLPGSAILGNMPRMPIRIRKSLGANPSTVAAEDDVNPPSINLTPAALEQLEGELAPEYSPPTFTPIGNFNDELARVDHLGDCDPE